MDSMRAILMMLGVVTHSALIFAPEQTWLIFSQNTDPLMSFVTSIIYTFRMPTFFVVSGYFCYLTLNKYQAKMFLVLRLKRLVIPFFCTALIINSFQVAFLTWTGWLSFELPVYIINGGFVSHLWFLTNLVVYFLFVGLIAIFFKSVAKLGVTLARQIFNNTPILLLVFIMPFFSLFILSLNKVGFPLYSSFIGVINTFSILSYLPFFIFGIALATDKEYLYFFCTTKLTITIALLFISLLTANSIHEEGGILLMAIKEYFTILAKWLSVLVCFYIFYRFSNKKSKPMRALSDSSYTVYLFHHFFVISLGVLLLPLNLQPIFTCVLLIALVIALTVAIHNYIISKSKILRFMFNGK